MAIPDWVKAYNLVTDEDDPTDEGDALPDLVEVCLRGEECRPIYSDADGWECETCDSRLLMMKEVDDV